MVLESLVSGKETLQHPLFMLFAAAIVGTTGIWLSYFTFPGYSSVLGIAFVTIALVPLMHRIFKLEEEKEAQRPGFAALFFARHFSVVKVYAFFFIGLILTYAFWYAAMAPGQRALAFEAQESTLENIGQLRDSLTGGFSGPGSACLSDPLCWLQVIFWNNASVLLLAVVFSFIYGAGAVFLIGWNASVIGVLIGQDIVQATAACGNILQGTATGLYNALGLVPHGLFESLGYFFGAIAGGIIGAAISKKRHLRGEFGTITKDSIVLLLYALGLLLLGAIIEAYAIIYSV